jgi:hypothetical protein
MSVMEVTFTKLEGRRYLMTVVRERGPERLGEFAAPPATHPGAQIGVGT